MLGGRTVAEWKEVMSVNEFFEWQAYYEIQPFGPYRDDVDAAIVASTIANANTGKKYSYKDFMPIFRTRYSPEKRMSAEQIKGFMEGLRDKQHGG